MTELEQEAKAFLKKLDDESGTTWTEDDEEIVKAFAKFAATTQYVERQKIAFAIETLKSYQRGNTAIYDIISELEQKL